MGWRCSQRNAFPRPRAIATWWNSCLMQVEESWGLTLWAMASPRDRMVEMVSSTNPPRVSATTGMKSTPAERQAERWDASLRWTPTCRAWPGVEAASCKVCCWRGEITWTSSAAGRPRLQVGRSTSADLEWESGTTLGASLVGAKAADWAAKNRTSRMQGCEK